MPDKVYNALFLCTGNSARSILAQCALDRLSLQTRLGEIGQHKAEVDDDVR